jgi:hypothetical protein
MKQKEYWCDFDFHTRFKKETHNPVTETRNLACEILKQFGITDGKGTPILPESFFKLPNSIETLEVHRIVFRGMRVDFKDEATMKEVITKKLTSASKKLKKKCHYFLMHFKLEDMDRWPDLKYVWTYMLDKETGIVDFTYSSTE